MKIIYCFIYMMNKQLFYSRKYLKHKQLDIIYYAQAIKVTSNSNIGW